MRVLKVFKNDIGNGPGIRVSVWCSGCEHACPECHNPETWAFDQGQELTPDRIERIVQLCDSAEVAGLTITGGDPLHPRNEAGTIALARAFKLRFPQKSVWVWTGYRFEELLRRGIGGKTGVDALRGIVDVLIDGRYNRKLRQVTLPYSGSSNQRVIDLGRWFENGDLAETDVNAHSRII